MREVVYNGKLWAAVNSTNVILPGSRLLLRGGVHSGDITNNLTNVVIEPYQDEHPIIDGAVTINGSDVTIRNLEIRHLGWSDRLTVGKQLSLNAPRLKIINCYIHDMELVGFWTLAVDAEMYGCLIRHTGRMDTKRNTGYGHSLYIQNGDGKKVIKHNIFLSPFNWNVHAYSEGGRIDNIDFVENISIQSGVLSGTLRDNYLIGGVDAHNILMDGNVSWGGRLGYLNFGNTSTIEMKAVNNYFPDGWDVSRTTLTESANNTAGVVGNRVVVFPNQYDARRLHVAIYNEDKAKSVKVDVSAYFKDGIINAYNVQDYPNDVQKLPIVDGAVSVEMINRSVASPYKWTAPPSTFPQFGAFVMVKQ